ncbi:hypothetical protein IAD21_01011 [Abditibacteriota bacterium]|nr:hypothetical protein IAD21_01011 [Abditibacteriota bacterium]
MTASQPNRTARNPERHQLNSHWATLPPLSPLTYYRRNIWRVLPVVAAIVISVFLIAAIVTLLNSVDRSIQVQYGSMKHYTILAPRTDPDVPPAILEDAAKLPQVKRVILTIPCFVFLKTVFGKMPIPIYGFAQKDVSTIVQITGNKVVEGRLPKLNQPEIALSRAWANNFRDATKKRPLRIGDIYTPYDEQLPTLLAKLRVVGIIDGGDNIAIADRTFLELELNEVARRPSYFYLPNDSQDLPALSKGLQALINHPKRYDLSPDLPRRMKVFTFNGLVQDLRNSLGFLYTFLAIADGLVICTVALLSGFLANIYFEQRLGEFGLLSALGFRRERLARRLVIETGTLVGLSWVGGIAFTALAIKILDVVYMVPHGLVLAPIARDALLYTLPTPILVGIASLGTVLTRLYRLDPIEIMERR